MGDSGYKAVIIDLCSRYTASYPQVGSHPLVACLASLAGRLSKIAIVQNRSSVLQCLTVNLFVVLLFSSGTKVGGSGVGVQ